jgi:chromatin remodeling complex protein RSC6
MAKKIAIVNKTKEDIQIPAEVITPATKKAVQKKVTKDIVEEEVVIEEDGTDSGDKTAKKRVTPTRDSVIASFDELIESVEKEIEVLRDSSTKTKGVKFLRTLGKKLKGLKGQSTRIISKRNSGQRKSSTNTSSGFLKPVPISKDIAKFAGWSAADMKSRVDVTKLLCTYIKDHNLQNEKDKRQIIPDTKLCKLLNFDPKTSTQPLTYFHLQSLLKNHFPKQTAVTA